MSATNWLVLYVVFWLAGASASGWLFYRRGLKDGADKRDRIHERSARLVYSYIEGVQRKLADVERKYFQARRDLEALKGGE